MAEAAVKKTTLSQTSPEGPPSPAPQAKSLVRTPTDAPSIEAHDIAGAEKVRDAVCKGAEWLSKTKGPFKILGKVGHYTCQTAKYAEKIAENPGDLESKMTHWAHRHLPNFLVRGLEFFIQLGE